jgi:hypothetical protein
MPRLIDVDELKECIDRYVDATFNRWRAVDCIDKQPLIIENFIQCKNCKYWVKCIGSTEQLRKCELAGYMISEEGYCMYGEVKNEIGRNETE